MYEASAEQKGRLINDLYMTPELLEFTISARVAMLNTLNTNNYHGINLLYFQNIQK